MDYSKGLPQKLAAIQRYLEDAKKNADDGDTRTERKKEIQKRFERLGAHKAGEKLTKKNAAF